MKKILAIIFFCLSISANAAPVTWTLQNVVFDDGGVATGSFDYDINGGVFSTIAITTTSGSMLGESEFYQYLNPDVTSGLNALYVTAVPDPDTYGDRALNLNFIGLLWSVGSVLDLKTPPAPTSFESTCGFQTYGDCSVFVTEDVRYVISGSISSVVPIPASFWLFGSAMGLLGWMRRKAG